MRFFSPKNQQIREYHTQQNTTTTIGDNQLHGMLGGFKGDSKGEGDSVNSASMWLSRIKGFLGQIKREDDENGDNDGRQREWHWRSSQATTLQSTVWKEWLRRKGEMTRIWIINGTGDMMSDSKSKGSGPLEANEVEVDEQRIRRRWRRWQMGVQRQTWLKKIIYV